MMRWIVDKSLKSRRVVVGFALVLVVVGVWQFPTMSVDVVPEFTPTTVQVQTEALGLSAAEVEQLITVPLEQDLLNGVAWLDVIRSESVPGLSSIEMIFEPGTPILRARQVVQERLTQAHALPNVSKPPQMIQPVSSTSRVMMVGLSSKQLSAIEIGVLARWTVRPKLLGVDGVANVSIFGQRERQLQVQVDPARLQANGVTLNDMIRTTGNALWVSPLTFLEASTPGTGGFIDMANQRLGVQHLSPIVSANDLAEVAIENDQGSVVRLGDVATVVEDHQPLIGDAIFTDGPGVLLVIEKFPGASTTDVTAAVDEALDALLPGLTGVNVDPFIFRPAAYVEDAVDNLSLALTVGAVLAVLVLLGLFLDWRGAFISSVAVLVSAFVAGLVLYLRDAPVNAMILAGLVLAIALAVDNAVAATMNITNRLKANGHVRDELVAPRIITVLRGFRTNGGNGRNGGGLTGNGPGNGHGTTRSPTAAIVREAVLDTNGPLFYGTLIVVVALLPLFFMNGLSGDAFLPPIALSYLLAVAASTLVALTLTPALGVMFYSRSLVGTKQPPAVSLVERAYDRLVAPTITKALPSAVAFVALLAVGIAVLPRFDTTVLPTFHDTNVLIHWDAPAGTSLPEMQRITASVNADLRQIPGVVKVGAHVGRAINSDQVGGVSSGELWVRVNESADYGRVLDDIDAVLAGYPGIDHEVVTYANERIRDVLAADEAPVDIRIYGENSDVLRQKADEVMAVLGDVEGIVDPRVITSVDEPSLAVEVDLTRAHESGVKPGDVRRAVSTLLSGIEVGALFEDQKVFEVVVRGTPEIRNSVSSVQNLIIDTPTGDHVRLGDVASVALSSTASIINREASSRIIDITARVENRDLGAVVSEVRDKLDEVVFPISYHAELMGDYQERKDAERRVLAVGIGAAIGVLLLLQAAFGSWRLALLVFVILPLSLVGGLLSASLDGATLTLGSIVGFFAVLGIAVRHAVVQVKRYQQLHRAEPSGERGTFVTRATRERVTPMLFAAVTAAIGLCPLVFLGNLPGSELVRPLAIVVLGGLVTTALVNLYVLPALYLRLGPAALPQTDLFEVPTADRPALETTGA